MNKDEILKDTSVLKDDTSTMKKHIEKLMTNCIPTIQKDILDIKATLIVISGEMNATDARLKRIEHLLENFIKK